MKDDIKILADKVNDLEHQILELNAVINRKEQLAKADNRAMASFLICTIPTIFLFMFLIGVNIDYRTDNRQISYNNENLVELTLSTITLLSGIYSLKKHRERYQIERDIEETENSY